jgi:uncharacterized protein YjbI with pentapeptide repeats
MRRRTALNRLPIARLLLAALGVTTMLSMSMVVHPLPALAQAGCTIVQNPSENNKTKCPSGAHLVRVDWPNRNLSYALLIEVNLSSANLTSANLSHASLVLSDLNHADADGANLSAAHLLATKLRGTSLKNANLSGALLNSADLTFANLKGATTTGADFKEAKWDDTICPDGTNSKNSDTKTCAGHHLR